MVCGPQNLKYIYIQPLTENVCRFPHKDEGGHGGHPSTGLPLRRRLARGIVIKGLENKIFKKDERTREGNVERQCNIFKLCILRVLSEQPDHTSTGDMT